MNFDNPLIDIDEPIDELDIISNSVKKEDALQLLGRDFDYMIIDDCYYHNDY